MELTKELEDDKAVHEMLACWCDDNEKEKSQAIEAAEVEIQQLEAAIGEAVAKLQQLKTQRKDTMDEMYQDQKALGEANSLRMKENQAFHDDEVNLKGAIQACAQAITVLEKHHTDFAQVKSVARLLQKAQVVDLISRSGGDSRLGVPVLKEFLHTVLMQTSQVGADSSFLAIPGFQSYAPQSGQIFGILKQMHEDFSDDLNELQEAEAKAVEEYNLLKAAKEQQIESAKKLVIELDAEIADIQERHAEEMQQLEDTKEQLALDKEFIANLEKKCSTTDEEFQQRVKDRLAEIAAVEDTIKILNDDAAYNVFDKTMATPSFIQVNEESSEAMQLRRKRAVDVLAGAVQESHSVKLALLMTSARLDAFVKVKEEINRLVEILGQQQKDEVAHRDSCVQEFAVNERETDKAEDKKDDLVAKVADLEKLIETHTSDIEAAKASIAESQKQMKRSSETREAENADFQQTMMDQQLTQAILQKALLRMKQVYYFLQQVQPGAPHIQTSGTHTDPGNGPARFKEYEKNRGGAHVVALLEEIIADSKKMTDDALAEELDAQEAYEDFMKSSNENIVKLSESITNLSAAKAKAEGELRLAKTDLKETVEELGSLHDTLMDLHKGCDYIMKNFDARQQARAAEVDALNEAKAILSGMK